MIFEKEDILPKGDIENIESFILDRFYMDRLPKEIEMVKENQEQHTERPRLTRVHVNINTRREGSRRPTQSSTSVCERSYRGLCQS